MLLLRRSDLSNDSPQLVAVFGIGLIGGSVTRALTGLANFEQTNVNFRWGDRRETEEDCITLARLFEDFRPGVDNNDPPGLVIVWCAGKAGFSAKSDEVITELDCFKIVLGWVEQLSRSKRFTVFFHLMSSLGGLYEGVVNVTSETRPDPQRPYGLLKARQEQELSALRGLITSYVYRPTSVYGFPGLGVRMGLIPTLIRNGLCNRVSRIIGGMCTLRDYVMARDIGDYVARNVLSNDTHMVQQPHLLASGKPSTIHEVQTAIEDKLGRKILISFDRHSSFDNSSDITVTPSALPDAWNPTDLRTGISLIIERMYSRGAITSAHW